MFQNVDLYSISTDNQQLAYDNRAVGTTEQIIPLGIRSGVLQNFTINAVNNTSVSAVLKDNLLHTETTLSGNTNYSFSITTDSATQGNNRFQIVLNAKPTVAIAVNTSSNITIFPNPTSDYIMVQLPTGTASYTISVTDVAGSKLQDLVGGAGSLVKIPVKQYSNGYYIVTVSDGKNITSKELLKTN